MKKNEKKLITILILSGMMTVFASVESLMMARKLLESTPSSTTLDTEVSYILLRFAVIITGALIVSVYSYITSAKLKVDGMYKAISTIIIIMSILGLLFSGLVKTKAIIYYIIIYLGLIYLVFAKE